MLPLSAREWVFEAGNRPGPSENKLLGLAQFRAKAEGVCNVFRSEPA